jgi:hypothetical protein
VAARVDLQPKAQWQCAQEADSWLDLFRMAANAGDEKTLRVSASIYKSTGGSVTARWICIGG